MLIAHRGVVSDTLTENSIASLEETIRRGYTHIEVDLRMTQDGEIVSLHDHSLKRTTGVSGYIDRVTLAELHEKVSPEIVPSLELFCQTIGGRIELMPDVKRIPRGRGKELAGALEALLSHYGLLAISRFMNLLRVGRGFRPGLLLRMRGSVLRRMRIMLLRILCLHMRWISMRRR